VHDCISIFGTLNHTAILRMLGQDERLGLMAADRMEERPATGLTASDLGLDAQEELIDGTSISDVLSRHMHMHVSTGAGG
jgi:hypothetical protein